MSWQAIYGISSKRIGKAVQQMKAGIHILERKGTSFNTTRRTEIAMAWMKSFFSRVGDRMPDGVELHLPSYLNFKMLHAFMIEDLTKVNDDVISYTQFVNLMKTKFPDVRIPKVWLEHEKEA